LKNRHERQKNTDTGLGIIARQSILNTLITYAGIGLGFILTILLYPHILDPDQYGLTRVLISASLICSQFAHLGFHNLVLRYFPFFKNADEKRHGLLFWSLTIPFTGFLLFSVLFFLFDDFLIGYYEEQSPLFVDFYLWVLPLKLLILYIEELNNYLRSLRDSTTGSVVNEVTQRIFAIIILAFYFFELINFTHFVILFVFSYISQPLIILGRIIRKEGLHVAPNFTILKKPLVRGMANYSLFSLLGGLTTVLVWNIDVIMLGAMAGLHSTAIYAIAFYIGSVIAVPQRSIEKIAGPLLSDFIKNKNWDEVAAIYSKTSLNQLIPGILIFGLIWINLDVLFLLLPEVYGAGKWVVFIIGIGKLVEVATGANGIILLNSKHYRVSFYTNIVLVVVTVGANYLLIPKYGIEGAAIASAMALFIFNTMKTGYIWLKMDMQPFNGSTIFIVILGASSIYLAHIISTQNLWVDVPLKSLFFLSAFIFPILLFKTSPDLTNLVRSVFKKRS
jgi:O-antigen/teichoic acid export membrane protein